MKNLGKLLIRFGGFLGLGACAILPPTPLMNTKSHRELQERVNAQSELAILFVGNSYSFGVPKAFAKLATSQGRKVRVGHSTFGGWTLERHACHEPTLKKIREGKWDVVVIQEQSKIPAQPIDRLKNVMFPAARRLANEARSHGSIPVLYQTWGRRDGDEEIPGDDFYAMSARLRRGYHAASRDAGGLLVIPAGDAWENEARQGQLTKLFIEDGSHPSAYGDEQTAKVFYRMVYGG